MRTVVVLVMHGVPPSDFPREEAQEFFRLHGEHSQGHSSAAGHGEDRRRLEELDRKMRQWPRTAENDPYHVGSRRLAEELEAATGPEVLLAFNEFCGPSIDEALDQAVELGAARVIGITPMKTSGGGHSEVDIPHAIDRARSRHPRLRFSYAWPFEDREIAGFLASQISRFLQGRTRLHCWPGGLRHRKRRSSLRDRSTSQTSCSSAGGSSIARRCEAGACP
jgi:sirohydrochlorin cobaltochelatase